MPHAIGVFERLRRAGLEAADAPTLLAEAYARAGRLDAARAALREAVRIHPSDPDTAFAMLALGERTRGLTILSTMRPSSSGGPALRDPRIVPFLGALHLIASRATSSS